jgi:hypothetical protein
VTASAALAQSVGATNGAINGKVTDASSAVMPGVTVTIASPSMQGTRTAVTNEEGTYRFPAIPPGDYKITYELAGFSTVVRDGIRVGLGFTAAVNVELKITRSRSVTVSGQSPVSIRYHEGVHQLRLQQLAALPNARGCRAIHRAAPVIRCSASTSGTARRGQTGYSTYDTKSDQHRRWSGIVSTGHNRRVHYDYGSVENLGPPAPTPRTCRGPA